MRVRRGRPWPMTPVSLLARPRRHPIRLTHRSTGVGDATLRYLLFVLLPGWFVPGLLDWYHHRRTDIEHTSGTRESLVHCAMMAEVGVPIGLALLCEINPLVLVIIAAAILAHEATALWDVRLAVDSPRTVSPTEQHVHSFLESLPFAAAAALSCLHWTQLLRLGRDLRRRDMWRLHAKRRPLPRGYLAAVAGAILTLVVLPYGEELVRCLRAGSDAKSRQPSCPRATATSDAASNPA